MDIQYSICIYRKSWESLRLSAGITPPLDNSFERFVVCPKQVQHRPSILINQPAGAPIPGYHCVDGCLSYESPFGIIQTTGHSSSPRDVMECPVHHPVSIKKVDFCSQRSIIHSGREWYQTNGVSGVHPTRSIRDFPGLSRIFQVGEPLQFHHNVLFAYTYCLI